MKNIKSIEQFLFESKATAKKRFLDRGLVSEETFGRFLEVDITPTKKFIEKMCEFFVGGSSEGEIIETFEKAISLSERNILIFDISLIKSIEELQSLISEKEDYKSRSEKRFIAQQGSEVTYEDDRFLVLYITTEEASKKYGKGTKWCISAEKDNQWDRYKDRGSRFYFIIDYKTKFKTLSKIAVEFVDNKTTKVWNSKDNKDGKIINMEYIYSELGVPKSAFIKHLGGLPYKEDMGIIRGSYTLNEDGSIDVDGDVNLRGMKLSKIPYKYNKVSGNFDCFRNNLTSLEGCPKYVGKSFDCSHNNLTSLEGCPDYVGGYFDCSRNLLTSLEFAPSKVGSESFDCSHNNLTSLEGTPSYIRRFICDYNLLTSLEFAPSYVGVLGGSFSCSHQKNGHKFTDEDVLDAIGTLKLNFLKV